MELNLLPTHRMPVVHLFDMCFAVVELVTANTSFVVADTSFIAAIVMVHLSDTGSEQSFITVLPCSLSHLHSIVGPCHPCLLPYSFEHHQTFATVKWLGHWFDIVVIGSSSSFVAS